MLMPISSPKLDTKCPGHKSSRIGSKSRQNFISVCCAKKVLELVTKWSVRKKCLLVT